MPFNIQGPELILILIIAVVILGPGKLPDVGQALGKSIREFRTAASGAADTAHLEPETSPSSAPSPRTQGFGHGAAADVAGGPMTD